MTEGEEQKTTEESHISRILAGDDLGKVFDRPIGSNDSLGRSKGNNFSSGFGQRFSNMFDPNEWRFIVWSGFVFILCILAFSTVGSLFTLFTSDDANLNSQEISTTSNSQITASNTDVVAGSQSSISQAKNTPIVAGSNQVIELPTKIEIPKIGINIEVRNPTSADYKVLDNELTKGAVRYPGSGYPGRGNMLLFGHSTGYKVVKNQAYKAFNNIKTLVPGDSIYIYTATKTYEYKVRKVIKVNKYDTKISFEGEGNMITLSTCDSFGTKSDRYVVEADLVG